MIKNKIKEGDLVTCYGSSGFVFHNCKVVNILDDGRIKAELPEPIKYIVCGDYQVESKE